MASSADLRRRATRLAPGGVHSNVRLGGPDVFIDRGQGAWLWDIDGRDYIDYLIGQGPNFLGHAPDPVVAAVEAACRKGLIYAGQHPLEVEAATAVLEALGWADMVRFGVSGTESVQAALRLARAATGRHKVIRFEGHYHGWLDNVLVADQNGSWTVATLGQPPEAISALHVIPWNDAEALAKLLEREDADVAAVIMEPVMINAGVIEPGPGYLRQVRELCDVYGVVLIFDEVISGFRVALGGAAERFGVRPDLATYGKAMASGWPASALAGKAKLMELLGTGKVNQSGTFNGSTMAMAATSATIATLRENPPYEHIERHGAQLMAGILNLGREYGLPLHVQGLPVAFHVSFGDSDAHDYRTLQRLDLRLYEEFAATLVSHGVWVARRGVWYVSAAHGDRELKAALQRVEAAMADWRDTPSRR